MNTAPAFFRAPARFALPKRLVAMIKKFMLVFVALSFASPILLTGCNTVEGAGKDVESAGKAVKNEARENKTY